MKNSVQAILALLFFSFVGSAQAAGNLTCWPADKASTIDEIREIEIVDHSVLVFTSSQPIPEPQYVFASEGKYAWNLAGVVSEDKDVDIYTEESFEMTKEKSGWVLKKTTRVFHGGLCIPHEDGNCTLTVFTAETALVCS